MTANELRSKYLEFFKGKDHTVIPSASLIPQYFSTANFTTAGMHPLVPFLLGENHPAGKKLVNCQRCIRTGDIDLVGDDTHLTFFEMLGNWSFGDYWKKKAIEWSWEFLTGKKWLALDPKRIYVTCFAGDADAPKDEESASVWERVGVPRERIAFLGKDDNWWGPVEQTGPCGPDTEMFYQVNTTEDERPNGADWPKGKYVEIWNDVFMQYNKTAEGKFEPLQQRNVDTGMGLERTLAVLEKVDSVFQTDVFRKMLETIRQDARTYSEKSARIIADHVKAAVFLIADGIIPSNKDQGYVLRRLIRKSIREAKRIGLPAASLDDLVIKVGDIYKGTTYPQLLVKTGGAPTNLHVFAEERDKFLATIDKGLKMLQKETASKKTISAKVAFDVYQTYGFPKELIEEESGQHIDEGEWEGAEKEHKNISRKGFEQKFKGGLADHSEMVVRMHTATHLLHQALKDVLGPHVAQKGSNITAERLRFDFVHPKKMTSEELGKVEDIVNQKVSEAIPVEKKILPLAEARKLGATGLFGEKYGETVSVYIIGNYSKEFCGGPHVQNTKEVGKFKILKEEAVSAGVRRIKAVVD